MSSNDKAKQQLMESMRMTKAGAENKIEKAALAENKISQDEKPAVAIKKTAASKKATAKKKAAAPKKAVVTKKAAVTKKITATKKTPSKPQKSAVDPFQTVRRVWPD